MEKEISFLSGSYTLSGSETAATVENAAAPSVVINPDGGLVAKRYKPVSQFSHLFNAYAQAYNKRCKRTGSLFEHPFHRKEISDKDYFKTMVLYIHNNPVHHGFTEQAMNYPWSSYLSCISIKPTNLQRELVMGWFNNEENFKLEHKGSIDVIEIEKRLGL